MMYKKYHRRFAGVRTAAVLMILSLIIGGCSHSTGPEFVIPVSLAAPIESGSLASNIGYVILTVTQGDRILLEQEVPFSNGSVSVVVDIPMGLDINFDLGAYSEDSVLLYAGSVISDVGLGEDITLNIQMLPMVLMLKVDPLTVRASINTQDSYYFDIYVYNVQDLFGASFRIEFPDDLIMPTSVETGTFLGDDPLSLVRIEDDYIAVAITRTGTDLPGVDGSGHLARIYFNPLQNGTGTLNFNTETASLGDPEGNPINGFTGLVLENGSLLISNPEI